MEDPVFLPEWDYSTNITVSRTLGVDLPRVRASCGLPADAELDAVIIWHSSRTNLRRTAVRVPVRSDQLELSGSLQGKELGGRLTLETWLLLRSPGTDPDPLAPRRPGTTLWSDRTEVTLEDEGQRFPVTALDFTRAGIAGGRGGAWALIVENTDPSASAAGSIRLLLNSSHPAIRRILESPATSECGHIEHFVRYDMVRQLVALAIDMEDLDDSGEYEAGTLGDLLLFLVRNYLPDYDLRTLRGLRRSDFGEVEAALQAGFRFLERQ